MKNKEKILIGLASFSFFLIVYLVIASQKIEIPTKLATDKKMNEEVVAEKTDLRELKKIYQETVKSIYTQLENSSRDVGTSTERINPNDELLKIKGRLISITVPEEYRSFHISLIILIDKVLNNNFVMDENFQAEINKIGEGNTWLK